MTTNLTTVNSDQKKKIEQKTEIRIKSTNKKSDDVKDNKTVNLLESQRRDTSKQNSLIQKP